MKLDLSNFSDLIRSQKWKWKADKKKKRDARCFWEYKRPSRCCLLHPFEKMLLEF